jgi:acyl-CoA thioesterase
LSETDEALARTVAAAMFGRDRVAQHLRIAIEEVRFGYARCSMTVTEEMLNGHDLCHGGYLFLLADTAFAYACNARNDANVALSCTISYSAPARVGDLLVAVAEERAKSNRTGTYDVTVSGASGTIVALFRGTSYQVNARVIRETAPE